MKYYFLILAQQNLLKNQVLEEILRERSNFYSLRNKITDFWILISPKFLSTFDQDIRNSDFFFQNKRYILSRNAQSFYSLIISPNKSFIEWLKLRLGYFSPIKKNEAIELFTIDGLSGFLDKTDLEKANFSSQNYDLHPNLLVERYERILQLIKS